MKIDTQAVLVTRSGEPLYNGNPDVPVGLGAYLASLIDHLPAGDVGNMRQLAKVADKLDGAVGEIELTEKEAEAVNKALEAPLTIPVWLRRNLEYYLADEDNGVGEWLAKYHAGAWRLGNESQSEGT